MKQALYDRSGRVIGFLMDERRIIDRNGRSVAWLKGANVYDYSGRHLGWWNNGHMRGPDGGVMVWVRGARMTGIILPIPGIPPIPPIPSIEPIRPIPQFPPIKPVNMLGWSNSYLLAA